jgi:hypothetical protein
MTVEFLRSPIDSATMVRNPDGTIDVICPGCPTEPGRIQGPFTQQFSQQDEAMAEATLAVHTVKLDGGS